MKNKFIKKHFRDIVVISVFLFLISIFGCTAPNETSNHNSNNSYEESQGMGILVFSHVATSKKGHIDVFVDVETGVEYFVSGAMMTPRLNPDGTPYVRKSTPIIKDNEDNNLVSLGVFRLTGYCDCDKCQEEWSGQTALGEAPEAGRTIAVDPDVIPLGTHVMINGHEYVAEDVGGAIKGNRIDVFVGSHEECFSQEVNQYTEVFLLANNE